MRQLMVIFLSHMAVVFLAEPLHAQYTEADTLKAVVPGLVYKEFSRTIQTANDDYRVTDPNATFVGEPTNSPSTFLPNPVLSLTVADLQGAVKAVAVIDCWGGHVGTSGKQFRFNANNWIDIPDIAGAPTNSDCYTQQYTTEVEVPLAFLIEGANVLEGLSGGQTCYNFGWGQWGWYGMVLRVFYDPAQKTPPTGAITSPVSGANIGEMIDFSADASSASGINRVDFIGYYDAFDLDGNGVYLDWQQTYQRKRSDSKMTLRNIIGTATSAPYDVSWDATYVPDQSGGGVSVVARIQDGNGLWYVTDRVDGLVLDRPGINVKMYKSTNTPENYWVNSNQTKSNRFVIPAEDNLADAASAQLHVATWNGINGQAEAGEEFWTRVNGWTTPEYGENHHFSYDQIDIPLGNVQYGNNTVAFYSESSHHGMEILWPGPGLVVRYVDYSVLPAVVAEDPQDLVAIEGTMATFTVAALGGVSLTYQWQENGVDIPGATNAVYTIPAVTTLDDGNFFRCAVSNLIGGETSAEGVLTVVVPGDRVTTGQVVLYGFDEGAGSTVADLSGFGAPDDLTIADLGAVSWLPGGLSVDASTVIATAGPSSKLITAVKASNEVTVEAWLKPANLTQNGPARIVSLSDSPSTRNFTLGQGESGVAADVYNMRLRTTTTDLNGTPDLSTPVGDLTTQLTHVVFTRAANGATKLFIDGLERVSGITGGDFSNWDTSYRLGVANELSGDRPWFGELHLVAIYDRALPVVDIVQNYAAGPIQFVEINVVVTTAVSVTAPVSLLAVPDGSGSSMAAAQELNGVLGVAPTLVDATILVTITDALGAPVVGFPAEKIGVQSQLGGWVQCGESPLMADAPTDVLGQTTISGALFAGGSSATDELLQVIIADPLFNSISYPNGLAGLEYYVNSPDLNASLSIDLSDVTGFASGLFSGQYNYNLDFLWDGVVNLSDVIFLGRGFNASCAAMTAETALRTPPLPGTTMGIAFDPQGLLRTQQLAPGQRIDAFVILDGLSAGAQIEAFELKVRVSDNVIIHEQRLVTDGLNIGQDGAFIAGLSVPIQSVDLRPVRLVQLRISVTDDEPAYFWLESSGATADNSPSLALGNIVRSVNPVSGDIALPVASLNDDDFELEGELQKSVVLSMDIAPNPFNPMTEIHFRLPKTGTIDLRIFDTRGRLVKVLRNEVMDAGEHSVAWRGTDDRGRSVAAGVYLSRLQTNGDTILKKMILVK